VPFSAIYWFCLEQFKLQWKRKDDGDPERPLRAAGEAFVNGAFSGMIAAGATTPFDVVKTRRQAISRTAEDAICHQNVAAV
jgi:solute carrier family 25 protein 39/40